MRCARTFYFNWLFIVALTARSYCDCHLLGMRNFRSSDFTAICWATSEVVHHFVNNNGFRSSAWVRKSRYWGEMLLSPIHYCDTTNPPYLLSGELCISPLHFNRLYVYTVCCRRGGQCFSVLSTRHTDVVSDSSGRSYVTEQGHNVPLLRTRGLVKH